MGGTALTSSSTKVDLKACARNFIETICNKRDFAAASTCVHFDMIQYHDDRPPIRGADTFLAGFKKMVTEIAPDFHITIKDVVAEGNKVWIFARIEGLPGGVVKDGVDMTVWSDDGKVVASRDVQRVVDLAAEAAKEQA